MAERIYIRDGDNLEPMEEQPFASEDDLQKLLAKRTELIDGERVSPGNPRRWLLVKREMGVPAAAGESARFSLDHLLVDQDARPTLVEVKRGSDTRIRREVVGQMLDYAANASLFWTVDSLRESFLETCRQDKLDPGAAMKELLHGPSEQPEASVPEDADQPDEDAFWETVATNLAAKNPRLLFVADAIPIELARIVEFLNAQMRDNIEVLAVEVKQFKSKSETRSALVPNVIGHTAALPTKRPPSGPNLTQESLLAEFTNSATRDAAERILKVAEDNDATLGWGKYSVSIRGVCPLWKEGHNPISIARIYRALAANDKGWRVFMFGTEIFTGFGEDPHPMLKTFLEKYAQQFGGDEHAEYRPTGGGSPRWVFKHEHVTAELTDVWAKRIAEALNDLRNLKAE